MWRIAIKFLYVAPVVDSSSIFQVMLYVLTVERPAKMMSLGELVKEPIPSLEARALRLS